MMPFLRQTHRSMNGIFSAVTVLIVLCVVVVSSRDGHLPSQLDSQLTCRLVRGLSKEQRNICQEAPDVAVVAFQGMQMAIKECQHQFRWHRWNCSSLISKSTNPHFSAIMKRGYRETAFLYALTSAAVAQSISRACALGRLLSCGCDRLGYRAIRRSTEPWAWGGCSHNLNYGIEFAKRFLDSRETSGDLQSRINVHNNAAGISILASRMEVRCKCHGVSGSCQVRTCWRATPDFRVVASAIKRQYRNAMIVTQDRDDGSGVLKARPRGRKRGKAKVAPKTSLLFSEKSPSFCEPDARSDSPGTSGRVCRAGRTSHAGSCDLLCCGRGYAFVRRSKISPCNCTFQWCCTVHCQRCKNERWISLCK